MPAYNILILEDEPLWQELLKNAVSDWGYKVHIAAGLAAAERKIGLHSYALIILDVSMDQPGFNAMCQSFCQSVRKRYPVIPIIAISGKNLTPVEMTMLFRDYHPIDFLWKGNFDMSKLRHQIESVLVSDKQSVKSFSLRQRQHSTDAEIKQDAQPQTMILLTVNQHETDALLDAFMGQRRSPPQTTIGGVTYHKLGVHAGCDVVHTICEMGAGSIGASQQRARDAIDHWKPVAIIAVGIAFGLDESKQRIGDVLVSTHIQDYELGRLNQNGRIIPRAGRPHASDILLNRVRATDASKSRSVSTWPKVRFGLLLTGQKLVDNPSFRNSLKSQFPEAIGGDMEAYGISVSAEAAKVDWIIIKSICDWGYKKNNPQKEAWQKLAAKNSARVLKEALRIDELYRC